MNIDEDKYPSFEDLKIDRNEEGEIIPIKGETPLLERPIIVKPIPAGANKEHFGDVVNPADADPDVKAEVMRKYFVRPDFSDITGDDIVDNLDRQTVNDYLQGLLTYSGAFRNDGELLEDREEDADNPNK